MANQDQITALVGGGPVSEGILREAVSHSSRVIGVDGGAAHLHAAAITPDVIIGDMDSAPAQLSWPGNEVPQEIRLRNQDTTDFEKAVNHCGPGLFLAVGFTGGRLDHYLAVLDTMLRHPSHHVILMDEFTIGVLAPAGETQIKLPVGTRLSLMPVAPTECRHSTGLEWPISGWPMALGSAISISNKVAQDTVTIDFSSRSILLQVPAEVGPSWAMGVARQT